VAGAFIPQTVSYSASLQYSLPYLHANVIDLGLPDFFNHLIPIVEVSFVTPVANNFGNRFVTTGFISPGVIWIGDYFQVGVEALIPSTIRAAVVWVWSDNCISISTTYSRPRMGNR
jgi:hypothetical protein